MKRIKTKELVKVSFANLLLLLSSYSRSLDNVQDGVADIDNIDRLLLLKKPKGAISQSSRLRTKPAKVNDKQDSRLFIKASKYRYLILAAFDWQNGT